MDTTTVRGQRYKEILEKELFVRSNLRKRGYTALTWTNPQDVDNNNPTKRLKYARFPFTKLVPELQGLVLDHLRLPDIYNLRLSGLKCSLLKPEMNLRIKNLYPIYKIWLAQRQEGAIFVRQANKQRISPVCFTNIRKMSLLLKGNDADDDDEIRKLDLKEFFYLKSLDMEVDESGGKVSVIPKGLEYLTMLKRLSLSKFDFKDLPKEILALNELEDLWIRGCPSLRLWPKELLKRLKNLKKLHVFGVWRSLDSVPDSLWEIIFSPS